jgi:chemotaxis signal transduction protein
MMNAENNTRPRWQVEQDYLDNLFGTMLEPVEQTAGHANADMGQPLDCQLIQVAGLMLAVPVSSYSEVVTDTADIEPVAGANNLLAGRVRHDGHMVDVISLESVVLTEKQPRIRSMASASEAGIILLLHDGVSGLLCDRLAERKIVAPERLCWREAYSRRIWLAATARSDGFALLDIEGIKSMLKQASITLDKQRPDGERA